MTVLTVSMPQGAVARTGLPQARELLAVSGFLLLQEAQETFRRAAVADLVLVEDLEDEMFDKRRPEQVYRPARLRRRAALLHRTLLPYLQVVESGAVFWLLAVGLQSGVLILALYVLHRTRIRRRLRGDDEEC